MSRPQVIDDQEYERVHERVAAIDVAKDTGMVCTRTPRPARPHARRATVRTVRARESNAPQGDCGRPGEVPARCAGPDQVLLQYVH